MRRSAGLAVVVSLLIVLWAALPAQAAAPKVVVDGCVLTFSVPPRIEQAVTLVPLRGIFEALGAQVYWDEESQTVNAQKGETQIQLALGSKTAYRNGEAVQLPAPAKAVNGSTLVPLRFIGEALGAAVDWDMASQTITITSGGGGEGASVTPGTPGNVSVSQNFDPVKVARQEKVVVAVICSGAQGEVSGSGVIVGASGLVVTNYHVIRDQDSGTVILSDGREYDIQGVISHNEALDAAVVKIAAQGLPVVQFGDSDNVQLGEEVMAIGSPFGLQNTVSTGVISGRRVIDGHEFIQTTASIAPGSSGGGLFNRDGALLGITTAGIEGSAIGFAIPVNQLRSMIKDGLAIPLSELHPATPPRTVIPEPAPPQVQVSYAEFAAWLQENQSVQQFGDYWVTLDHCEVFEDDATVIVGLDMDTDNFYWWLQSMASGGQPDIESFLYAIAAATKTLYPNLDVFVAMTFSDSFEYYPYWCPAEYIEWNPDTLQWDVFMPLVTASDYGRGIEVEFPAL